MLYKVKVIPLTSIHVGTGNELEPYNYVILQKNSKEVFTRFDFYKFIKSLSEEKLNWFLKLLDGNNLQLVTEFVRKNLLEDAILYNIQLEENFDIDKALYELPRNSFTQEPYIPASSIKGAIRTAIMYYKNKQEEKRKKDILEGINYGKDYEAIIANYGYKKTKSYFDKKLKRKVTKTEIKFKTEKDPFRLISISDAIFPIGSEEIRKSIYLHKTKRRDIAKEIYVEAIKGNLGKERNIDTVIDFTINNNFSDIRGRTIPSFQLTLNKIINECNEFYYSRFTIRKNLYEQMPDEYFSKEIFKKIEDEFKKVKEFNNKNQSQKQCIIRLGRFAQIENYLLKDDNRERRTRRVSDLLYPFGFLKLEFFKNI